MEIIIYENQDKVLCLDLSYYVFYRYHAITTWLKKRDEDKTNYEELFLNKYHEMFEKKLVEIVKKYKVLWHNVYLARDCVREQIWRNEFHNKYKEGRNNEDLQLINKTFKETALRLIVLKEKYGFHIIEHDALEADDVIALFKKHLKSELIIITNDNDFIQLCDEKTKIYNLQGDEIKDRIKVDPKIYLECKIIMGDKSDNINAIMKKIGPKTAQKFASNKELLEEFLAKNSEAKTNYTTNKLLIDFEMIPIELQNAFANRINLVLKE
jgi:5'-3' exonuclease